MTIINDIDAQKFSFNGVEYYKNFTPVAVGNKIRILNVYDSSIELTSFPTLFSDFEVDGNTFLNVATLQSALLPVLYTRETLGGSGGEWGSITGNLADQTDLQNALDLKLDKSTTPSSVYATDASGNQEMISKDSLKDVLEFADLASFPVTGETGKIYLALDTNFTYRWSGSAYVQVGGGYSNIESNDFSLKYQKNYFTDISDFTATSLTPNFIDGKLRLSGGVGNFNQYLTFNGLKNTDENLDFEVIFRAVTVVAGSFGIAIGKKSINSWYKASIACHLSPVQNTAFVWDSDTATQITNRTTGTINANDVIKLRYTQIANNIVFTWYNLTQNTSDQISILGNLGVSKNFKVPNSSDLCLWNLGGTMDILSIKVTSLSHKNPDVICIGDSKTQGYSSTNNNLRWASNLNNLGVVIVNGGDGDRTVETAQTINYTKEINAKYAILAIGRNDLGSGVSSSVWQANYQNIVNQLVSKGTIVIHLLPIPETVVSDQSSLKNWIISTYGSANCIDPSIGWNNTTMLSSDNVHPNEVGHAFVAKTILESGLIPFSDKKLPKINEIGSNLTANTANYIPYSNGGSFQNSEFFRLSSGKYGLGTSAPYNYGSNFNSLEIAGGGYGIITLSKIGNNLKYYFSSDGINMFLGVNNNGAFSNSFTVDSDGDILFDIAGTIQPLASAKVQINSTTKGFLPPRMTNAQRIAIASPAIGLMVYCTDTTEGLYVYKSTGWTFII